MATTSIATLRGHQNAVPGLSWSPDGRKLASASLDGTLRIWPGVSEEFVQPATIEANSVVLRAHDNGVLGVAWSPDGKRLASASFDGTARIWPATAGPAGQAVNALVVASGPNPLTSVAWSPDGGELVTASRNREARIWPLELDNHGLQSLLRKATRECLKPSFRVIHLGETRGEAEALWRTCTAQYGRRAPE